MNMNIRTPGHYRNPKLCENPAAFCGVYPVIGW